LLPLLAAAGAAMTMSNTAANSLLQMSATLQMLGRTVSLYMLAMRGGSSIGALITGVTADRYGVQRALLFNGLAAILAHGAIAITSRGRAPVRRRPTRGAAG